MRLGWRESERVPEQWGKGGKKRVRWQWNVCEESEYYLREPYENEVENKLVKWIKEWILHWWLRGHGKALDSTSVLVSWIIDEKGVKETQRRKAVKESEKKNLTRMWHDSSVCWKIPWTNLCLTRIYIARAIKKKKVLTFHTTGNVLCVVCLSHNREKKARFATPKSARRQLEWVSSHSKLYVHTVR